MLLYYFTLFVKALMFSEKWIIFYRTFFGKLSHFSVFDNDLENEFENIFWYLVCVKKNDKD